MYELVNTHTGNLIGEYSSRDEALEIVRRAIERRGRPYVMSYSLNHEDARGRFTAIAHGKELADLAMPPASRRVAV